jgi:hypothetical protein
MCLKIPEIQDVPAIVFDKPHDWRRVYMINICSLLELTSVSSDCYLLFER